MYVCKQQKVFSFYLKNVLSIKGKFGIFKCSIIPDDDDPIANFLI